jgi:nitrogen regulatory protein PII
MKLVKAYVRKVLADQVVHALEKIGAPRMTAIDVRALGDDVVDESCCCVSVEYGTTYEEMVKLEIISTDDKVRRIVDAIRENAKTVEKGDGVIAVSPIDEVFVIQAEKK